MCIFIALVSVFFFSTVAPALNSDDVLHWKKIPESEFVLNPQKPDYRLAYLHSLYEIAGLIFDTGESSDAEFYKNHRARKSLILKMNDSPFKRFYLGELNLHSAIANGLADRKVQAFLDLRKSFIIHEENLKKHPGFVPSCKTVGAVRVLAGLLPDKFNKHSGLVGLDADTELGMRQLEMASAHESVKTESLYLMAMLSHQLGNKKERWPKAFDIELNSNPNAWPTLHLACEILLKRGENEPAFALLQKAERIQRPTSHLLRIRGEVLLRRGNYAEAKKMFERFTEVHTGNDFFKDAYYKWAVCEMMDENEKAYSGLFKKIKEDAHNTRSVSDKYALYAASNFRLRTPELLKARYLLDGGYTQRADSVLHAFMAKDSAETTEKLYRMAQSCRLKGQYDQEKRLYEQVIMLCGGHENGDYICPVSCLKLGRILAEKGQKEQAKIYFERALAYKNHPYKEETDRSAKSELKKLR